MPWGQRLAMSSSKTSPVCPPAIPSPLTSAHTRALISFFTLAQSERGGLSWWWSCRHDCQNRGWGAGAAGSLGLRVKERQRQRKNTTTRQPLGKFDSSPQLAEYLKGWHASGGAGTLQSHGTHLDFVTQRFICLIPHRLPQASEVLISELIKTWLSK